MKATKDNYKKLCTVMYEFTGLVYWIEKPNFLGYDIQQGNSYFGLFYEILKEVKEKVNSGEVCKFPLWNVGKKSYNPYTINTLEIKF